MDDQIDPQLLERFLAGECSSAEREEVARWVNGSPERQALLNAMRTAWVGITTPPRRYDSAAAWTSVAARLQERVGDARVHAPRPVVVGLRRQASGASWRVAAIVVAVLGLGGLGVWSYQANRPPRVVATTIAAREVATPRGQRATIRLSDGSTVMLAPASRLREPTNFGVDSRDVWLDGEAYFDIAHNATKPFRVHAGRVEAHDLGTKFLVRAYSESPDVRVVVAEGVVSLQRERDSTASRTDSVVIRARSLGRLDADNRLVVEPGVPLDDYTAWTDGRLVFTDVPLRDVIPRLSRWYDIDLRLGDAALGRETFTATLTHEPVSEVLQLLAATVRARIERRGNTVILLRGEPR